MFFWATVLYTFCMKIINSYLLIFLDLTILCIKDINTVAEKEVLEYDFTKNIWPDVSNTRPNVLIIQRNVFCLAGIFAQNHPASCFHLKTPREHLKISCQMFIFRNTRLGILPSLWKSGHEIILYYIWVFMYFYVLYYENNTILTRFIIKLFGVLRRELWSISLRRQAICPNDTAKKK